VKEAEKALGEIVVKRANPVTGDSYAMNGDKRIALKVKQTGDIIEITLPGEESRPQVAASYSVVKALFSPNSSRHTTAR
jgi:hypothetical protein